MRKEWLTHVLVIGSYLLLAGFVTFRIWLDPASRLVAGSEADASLNQWFLAHAAYAIVSGENPLLSSQMNYPAGFNIVANATFLGLALPVAPLTLALGPQVTFNALLFACLAGTAAGWYVVLGRSFVTSRLAAALGGGFCGFAPGMVSRSEGHLHIAAQFLVPFIVWYVVRLREQGRAIRNGMILGLLVAVQALISEETLLFTAAACGLFVLCYAAMAHREIRTVAPKFLLGLGMTAATAGLLLAYPLYVQFFGPMHHGGLNAGYSGADIASYFAFSSNSLAGRYTISPGLMTGFTEQNAFLGLPLVILLVGIVVWLWRAPAVRALAITAVMFALFSLGMELRFNGSILSLPGPWSVLAMVSPFNSVVPSRFALVVIPIIGILLALATDRVLGARPTMRFAPRDTDARWIFALALAVALIPLVPLPYRTSTVTPVPQFIQQDAWRDYTASGHSLVPVPLPSFRHPEPLRWAAATSLGFKMPRGYFLVPRNGIAGEQGVFEAPERKSSTLFDSIAATGESPSITDKDRQDLIKDLRYWNAGVVVLGPSPHEQELLQALNMLLGPGARSHDVWIWDVRELAEATTETQIAGHQESF